MNSTELSQTDIHRLINLLEIEEIRNLKLRYSQLMDNIDIEGLAQLFTEDAVCHFGPYGQWAGRDEIRDNYRNVMSTLVRAPFGSMHHICNHWVELKDAITATGRSYLIDVLTERKPDENPVLWYALYDEEYRKVAGSWKISYSCIHFLWPARHVDEAILGQFPQPGPP
jgi:hypothetical protein